MTPREALEHVTELLDQQRRLESRQRFDVLRYQTEGDEGRAQMYREFATHYAEQAEALEYVVTLLNDERKVTLSQVENAVRSMLSAEESLHSTDEMVNDVLKRLGG